MQLSDDDIREFAALWKEEFGEEISDAGARRNASQLLRLYSLLLRPPELTESGPLNHQSDEVLPLLPEIN